MSIDDAARGAAEWAGPDTACDADAWRAHHFRAHCGACRVDITPDDRGAMSGYASLGKWATAPPDARRLHATALAIASPAGQAPIAPPPPPSAPHTGEGGGAGTHERREAGGESSKQKKTRSSLSKLGVRQLSDWFQVRAAPRRER